MSDGHARGAVRGLEFIDLWSPSTQLLIVNCSPYVPEWAPAPVAVEKTGVLLP